ncbi:MAG: AraC family transcriptional regulator [Elusimicrobia bacterium]|nr:AraC family transcriptional regulator [Elusimicrobiota bacterium]
MDYNWEREVKKNTKLFFAEYYDPYREVEKHYHSFNELVIIIKGSLRVEISKKTFHANPGDILFYRERVAHKEVIESSGQVGLIAVLWRKIGQADLPILTYDKNKKIRFLAQWLCEINQSKSPYASLLQEQIFEVILTELTDISKSKELHPIVSNIRNFMKDHLKEHLSVEKLASHACMSKYSFFKKYKEFTDRTPMKDLRIIRVETAKDMIFTTDVPLKTISKEVGFVDEYQFSKVFRKHFGAPPGHFRKNTIFSLK